MYGASHRLGAFFDEELGGKVAGIWVDVFKMGSVYIPTRGESKEVIVDADFVLKLEENFNLMKRLGHMPVVEKQHAEDGYNYGDVLAVRTDGEWFQAFITLKDPEDRRRYNLGMIERFSPTFSTNYFRSDTGERIGPHMFGLAFVTHPHQINLREPQVINPGVTLGAQQEPAMDEEREEAFDARQAFAAVTEQFGALTARLEALEAKFMDGDEEDEEMAAKPDAAVASLSARLAEVEAENTRLQLSAYDIDEKQRDHLVALKSADVVLFNAHVATLPVKGAPVKVQEEIGTGGGGEGSESLALSAILDEAVQLGLDPKGARFVGWAAENHAKRFDELVQAGREMNNG